MSVPRVIDSINLLQPELDCAEPVSFIYHLFLNQATGLGYTSPRLKAFCGYEPAVAEEVEDYEEASSHIRIPEGEPALLNAFIELFQGAKQTDATVQKM